MKRKPMLLQVGLMIMLMHFQTACHPDKGISPEEEQTTKILGVWILDTIVKDNQDITSLFPDFTLEFNDKLFTSNGAGGILSPTGSWEFKSGDLNTLEMDGLEITLSNLTATTLNMAFTKPVPGGRTYGLEGQYQLELIKQ